MTYLKVLRWMLLMILIGGISGAGYAFWLWNQSDEMLRERVQKKLNELAPEWDIHIEDAHFDVCRRIHIYNLTMKAKDHSSPILTLPEAVITVDQDKLWQQQEFLIHKIRLLNPSLELIRDSAGHWNWQDLPQLPEPDRTVSLPEFEIQKGNIRIRFEHGDNQPTAAMTLKNADVRCIPSAKRRFLFEGTTQVQDAGTLVVNGDWDFDEKTWSLDGKLQDVMTDDRLLSLAIGFSPELRARIVKLDEGLRKITLTSNSQQSPADKNRSDPVASLGVSATLDVKFHISCPQPHTEPEFRFELDIKNGQIANSALPFPLRDISGNIYWDNRKIVIQKFSSANGVTRFVLDGQISRQKERTPGRFQINIHNLLLDKRLYQRLPVALKKHYAMLEPSGTVDLKGMLDFDGVKTWAPYNFVLTAKGCSIRHVKFPFKVQDILGEIVQRSNHLEFNMGGHAGRRPVRIQGRIINPGPEAESEFVFQVERLPIDDAFLVACDERTRKTLQALNLKGYADVEYRYHRPPGLNRKPRFEFIAYLQNCSMESVCFKYRLTNLTGTVTHSSVDGSYAFHELRANHDSATVTGSGSFIQFADISRLELNLSATNAQFDDQLKQALPVPLQKVWEDFKPLGKLNVDKILIHWIPGRPVEITLPSIEISDASFVMQAFPLTIQNVRAKLSYYQRINKTGTDVVTIHSFSGKHDDSVIRAEGYSTFAPNGDWRVRLTKLNVDDLVSTRKFRDALPKELRSVFNELNLERPVSFSGMVEFKGTNDPADPVTAAWDLQTILTGNSLTTGIDLEQAFGAIDMLGTWDGKRVLMDGSINLDSVYIWDHQFTQVRGPFRLVDTRLTVGTPEAFRPRSQTFEPASIPRENRLTARAIGGMITLDADVKLETETSYRVKMTMNGGRLDEYAKRYLPGVTSLSGMMTGEIVLQGKGSSSDRVTGGGWLQISPAALYELPVMLQIFNLLSFVPGEKSAFTYALLNFNIGNEKFHFDKIFLVGNTISFFGKGTATFDGDLNLRFASELPPSRTFSIPFVSHVVRGATRNWVGIFVTGKVNSPKAESRPIPQLDEALKKIFGVFEPRMTTPPPGRIFPRFSPLRRPASPSFPQRRKPRSR